jgi:hypothetical protein
MLASRQSTPEGLTVYGPYVYWTDGLGLKRVCLAGGETETLAVAAEEETFVGVAVDAKNVYWASMGGQREYPGAEVRVRRRSLGSFRAAATLLPRDDAPSVFNGFDLGAACPEPARTRTARRTDAAPQSRPRQCSLGRLVVGVVRRRRRARPRGPPRRHLRRGVRYPGYAALVVGPVEDWRFRESSVECPCS